MYPFLFITASLVQTIGQLSRLAIKWAQYVRDTEYLVDLRLQNMDDSINEAAQSAVLLHGDVDRINGAPPLGDLFALEQ